MIKIELIGKSNEFEWENFVDAYISKEYGFTLKWRNILREVFGYDALYYLIREDAKVIGILPTFIVKSKIFKDRLISIPFTDMGGFCFIPLVKDDTKLETFYKIEKRLKSDSKLLSKEFLPFEIRGPSYESNNFLLRYGHFIKISPYVKFIIRLDTPWENIENAFGRNIRRNLAKSKGKLELCICKDIKLLLGVYDIYLREMRRLGSPPLPMMFFEKLWYEFGLEGNFIIFTASYKNKIIGAISLIAYKDTIYADLIMSVAKYNCLFPKYHLYLTSLKYAWNSKRFTYYDFNRTRRQSGVFEHKRRWGAKIEKIYYFYHNDQRGNNYFLDPSQKRFLLMSKFIRHCPLNILRISGKFLRKQVGK